MQLTVPVQGGNTVWGCKTVLKWFIFETEEGNYFGVGGTVIAVMLIKHHDGSIQKCFDDGISYRWLWNDGQSPELKKAGADLNVLG